VVGIAALGVEDAEAPSGDGGAHDAGVGGQGAVDDGGECGPDGLLVIVAADAHLDKGSGMVAPLAAGQALV
jgi:hypothetical protein